MAYAFVATVLTILFAALLYALVAVVQLVPGDLFHLEAVFVTLRQWTTAMLAWGAMVLLACLAALILRDRAKLKRARRDGATDPDLDRAQQDHEYNPGRMVVAITAYNEAKAIRRVVEDFRDRPGVIEVVVVDNNSRDDTARIAAEAGARVVREERQGYGYCCQRGLLEAAANPRADVIVLTEGDGTFSGADLDKFPPYLRHADMVLGNRVVKSLVEPGSQMDYFFTWGNIFIASVLRLRFWDWQFLGKAQITDVGCTYRAIHRDALLRILPDLVVGGNSFSPHMILVALSHRLTVIEIPVTFWRRVGDSKGASQSVRKGLNVGFEMIWHILTFSRSAHRTATRPTVSERQPEPSRQSALR